MLWHLYPILRLVMCWRWTNLLLVKHLRAVLVLLVLLIILCLLLMHIRCMILVLLWRHIELLIHLLGRLPLLVALALVLHFYIKKTYYK